MSSRFSPSFDAVLRLRICRITLWPQLRVQQVVQATLALLSNARTVDECTEFVDFTGAKNAPGSEESSFVELQELGAVKKIMVHSDIL
jgi:hypothetical protein